MALWFVHGIVDDVRRGGSKLNVSADVVVCVCVCGIMFGGSGDMNLECTPSRLYLLFSVSLFASYICLWWCSVDGCYCQSLHRT